MSDAPKRPLLKQLTEGLIAVALVLVFFFIIMLVLNALFPYGGLQLFAPSDVTSDAGIPGRLRPEQRIEVAFGHGDQTLDPGKWAATLVEMRNLVKSKRATDIAWKSAEADMPLYSLDAVQTLEDSSARIRFDARNEIHLGANSLVVIRRMEQDLLFREKRTFMVVVDGELRGRLGGEENGNVFLEVTTPNAVARLKTGDTGSEPVEFSIGSTKTIVRRSPCSPGRRKLKPAGRPSCSGPIRSLTSKGNPHRARRLRCQRGRSSPLQPMMPGSSSVICLHASSFTGRRRRRPMVSGCKSPAPPISVTCCWMRC